MVAHRHASKIGGLTVAVGLGVAVATGQGTAGADPGDPDRRSQSADSKSTQPANTDRDPKKETDSNSAKPESPDDDDDVDGQAGAGGGPADSEPDAQDPEESEDPEEPEDPADPEESGENPDGEDAPESESEAVSEPAVGTRPDPGAAGKATSDDRQKDSGIDGESGPVQAVSDEVDDIEAADDDAPPATKSALATAKPNVELPVPRPARIITVPAVPLPQRSILEQIAVSVVGIFGMGPGIVGPASPGPPTPSLLELVFVALRRLDHQFFNEHPYARPLVEELNADGVITGTVGAVDPDGDALVYTVSTGPKNGTVEMDADGGFTYTPNAGFTGADGFTVTVSDDTNWHLHLLSGYHGDLQVPVSIVVGDLAPTITDVVVESGSDGTSLVTVKTSGGNGAITVTLGADPKFGSVRDHGDGTFTFDPDAAYEHELAAGGATDPVGVGLALTVADADGDVVNAIVTVTLTPVNSAPEFGTHTDYDAETGTTTTTVELSDSDGDDVTVRFSNNGDVAVRIDDVEVAAGQTHVITHPAGRVIVVTHSAVPDPNGARTDVVSFTVDDGHGGVVGGELAYEVGYADLVPSIEVRQDGDTFEVIRVEGNGSVTVVAEVDPGIGAVRDNGDGTFTFVADPGFAHGLGTGGVFEVAVRFTATDVDGDTAVALAQATVTGVNSDPVVEVGDTDVDPDSGWGTTIIRISDPDGDPVTVRFTNRGEGVVRIDGVEVRAGEVHLLTYSGGAVVVQHLALDPAGARIDVLEFEVTDGLRGTTTGTAELRVDHQDLTPRITDVRQIDERTFEVTVTGGNGPVTVTGAVAPGFGEVVSNDDGTFTFVANEDFLRGLADGETATAWLSFIATDADGSSAETNDHSVTLVGINDNPTVEIVEQTYDATTGWHRVVVRFDDPDGGTIEVRFDNAGQGVMVVDGVRYLPGETYSVGTMADEGGFVVQYRTEPGRVVVTDVLRVSVTDEFGAGAGATVELATPAAPNRVPVITEVVMQQQSDGSTIIRVVALGGDGELTLSLAGDPQFGTVEHVDGFTYRFTPNPEFIRGLTRGETVTIPVEVVAHDVDGDTARVRESLILVGQNSLPTVEVVSSVHDQQTGTTTKVLEISDRDADRMRVVFTNTGTAVIVVNGVRLAGGAQLQFDVAPNEIRIEHTATPDPLGARMDSLLVDVHDDSGATSLSIDFPVPQDTSPRIDNVNVVRDGQGNTSKITVVTAGGDGAVTLGVQVAGEFGTLARNDDGSFTFTPDAGYSHELARGGSAAPGLVDIIVTATDAAGQTVTTTVIATVLPTNSFGFTSDSRYHAAIQKTITRLTLGDDDGDTLQVRFHNSGLSVAWVDGVAVAPGEDLEIEIVEAREVVVEQTAVPDPDGAREDILTVEISDGFGGFGETELVHQVAADVAPSIEVQVVQESDGTRATYEVRTVGGNGVVRVRYTVDPLYGTVVRNTDGTYTFTANPNYALGLGGNGSFDAPITFAASDDDGDRVEQVITARIAGINVAPTVTEVSRSFDPTTGSTTLTMRFRDQNPEQLSVTVRNGGSVSLSYGSRPIRAGETVEFVVSPAGSGVLTFTHISTPDPDGARVDPVTFVVTDGLGAQAELVVEFDVPAAVAPTVTIDSVERDADGSAIYTVSSSGGYGALAVGAGLGAHSQHGTVEDLGEGRFRYTPSADWAHQLAAGGRTTPEAVDVTFTAVDTLGMQRTVSDTFDITPQNEDPASDRLNVIASPGLIGIIAPSKTATFTVSDTDGDSLAVAVAGSHGTGLLLMPTLRIEARSQTGVIIATREGLETVNLQGIPTGSTVVVSWAPGLGSVLAPTVAFHITIDDGHGGVVVINA